MGIRSRRLLTIHDIRTVRNADPVMNKTVSDEAICSISVVFVAVMSFSCTIRRIEIRFETD